jgi:hypothetical protein
MAPNAYGEHDEDGIDAEILFPPVFATRFIEGVTDDDGRSCAGERKRCLTSDPPSCPGEAPRPAR